MHLYEKTIATEPIYDGKILKLRRDTVELENGQTACREVVEHSGGVCVLPITEKGTVLLVKQFRYPFGEVLLEVPAGKLNPGEDPAECGRRELLEEVGASAAEFIPMGVLYPTTAYLTEKIYMYFARGLTFSQQKLDEDEFLDVVELPFEEAVERVLSGEIKDSKTQIALMKGRLQFKL